MKTKIIRPDGTSLFQEFAEKIVGKEVQIIRHASARTFAGFL